MARINKSNLDKVKKKATQTIRRRKLRFSTTRLIVFGICAVVLGLSFLFVSPIEKYINFSIKPINEDAIVSDDDLKIHYIDVGQGDAIFIELPDDKNMLIDAGPKSSSTKLINYIDHMIFDTSVDDIDYFVLTHSDEDHVGGATKVLERYNVLSIYRPKQYSSSEQIPDGGYVHRTKTYDSFVKAMDKETDDIVFNGATITIDGEGYNFYFFGPIEDSYDTPNDFSPIIVLTYTTNGNTKKFMFTGDATSESGEKEVIDTYASDILDIDVLKVGHHGSEGSSSADFLSEVKPEYAVISVGEGNKYGHPTSEALTRLTDSGAEVLRTDTNGSIMFFVTSAGEMNYVVDTYVPNNYYIKWWYVVSVLGVVLVACCFYGKASDLKVKNTISSGSQKASHKQK